MKALSLSPVDAVKGMAGVQDGTYRVVNAFMIAQQNPAGGGGQEPAATKMQLVLHPLVDGKLFGTETEIENYKVGDLINFAPSQDGDTVSKFDINGNDIGVDSVNNTANLGAVGKYVIPTGSKSGITDQCKFMLLMTNLVNKQFDIKRMSLDPSYLIGLEAHFTKQATKKNEAGKELKEEDKKFASNILLVERVIKFPYESGAVTAPGQATAGAPATSAPAASAPAGGGAVEMDKLLLMLKDIVAANKAAGTMTLSNIKAKGLVMATRDKAKYGHPPTQAAALLDANLINTLTASGEFAVYDADTQSLVFV